MACAPGARDARLADVLPSSPEVGSVLELPGHAASVASSKTKPKESTLLPIGGLPFPVSPALQQLGQSLSKHRGPEKLSLAGCSGRCRLRALAVLALEAWPWEVCNLRSAHRAFPGRVM